MTVQTMNAHKLDEYNRQAILSAPPARLLTMLYDRLILDLKRAEYAQTIGDWQEAHSNLLHAQDIVRELSSTLKTGTWDGAEDLRGIYAYVLTALMNANIRRDVGPTRECIELLKPLGEAWHEAASSITAPVPSRVSGGMLGVG